MKSNSVATHFHFRRAAGCFAWRAWCTGLAALVLLPITATAQTITSAVPGFITYQGKVSNAAGQLVGAGTPVNRTVIFRIWSHATNSTANDLVYSEQQTVTISDGEFSVLVGQGTAVGTAPLGYSESGKGPNTTTISSAAVFGGASRYLGVTIDDGTAAADPEVSPRQQMVTSAYAFRAKYAESLGANGTNTITALDNGNVGIGSTNPGFPLTFASSTGDKISLFGQSGAHYGFGVANSLLQIHSDTVGSDVAFGYGASASMTETMRIKGNGNVGIGTSNPTAKLDVNGILNVFDGAKSQPGGLVSEASTTMINFGMNDTRFGTQTAGQQGGFLRVNTQSVSNLFQFFARPAGSTTASEIMTITSAGNVGIGTGSPSAKLHVNGSLIAGSITASSMSLSGAFQVPGNVSTHTQGAWLEWNKDASTGRTYLLNQRGSGSGGMVFGEVDTANGITERLSISSAGYVSAGNLALQPGTLNGAANTTAATLDIAGTGTISVWDNFVVSGNVGIGTTAPVTTLDVRSAAPIITVGTTSGTNGGIYLGNSGHGLLRSYPSTASGNNHVGLYTTAGDVYLSGNGQSTNHLVVKNNGYVGIGHSSPSAPLHVHGGAALGVFFLGAKVWPDTTGDDNNSNFNAANNGWGTTTHSIIADNRIRAAALDITNIQNTSDARIKRITGLSSGAQDLRTLMAVEVTDYTLIDAITHGRTPQKKVIAQQVEQVYPQAASRATGVVPDIYQKADTRDGWIALATSLKAGDRVRLIAEEESGVHEVLEAQADRFRTAFKPKGEKIFVYGREVKDFGSVDYDAIAMLNVSATQELKREKDAEIGALKQRIAELETRDRVRDAKLATIEKLLQSAQTVMARPAAPGATANGQD